ncbi:hypothetical protein JCM8547_002292 [Rhodosporidiobolus lusitaniae]
MPTASEESSIQQHLGNAAFKAKPLADPKLVVLRRPSWSKAYARVAEVHARKQDFQNAEKACAKPCHQYETDPAALERYRASLAQTLSSVSSAATSRKAYFASSTATVFKQAPTADEHHMNLLWNRIEQEEYTVDPRGAMAVTAEAHGLCHEGNRLLHEAWERRRDGKEVGDLASRGARLICNAMLLDKVSFHISRANDEKYEMLVDCKLVAPGGQFSPRVRKYLDNSLWSAADIVKDLDRGWSMRAVTIALLPLGDEPQRVVHIRYKTLKHRMAGNPAALHPLILSTKYAPIPSVWIDNPRVPPPEMLRKWVMNPVWQTKPGSEIRNMSSASDFEGASNAAFAAKKYLKASKEYSKAIELEKDDVASAALLSNRSASYLQLNEYDKALEDANLACVKRPMWSKAFARVAEVYARQQNFLSPT